MSGRRARRGVHRQAVRRSAAEGSVIRLGSRVAGGSAGRAAHHAQGKGGAPAVDVLAGPARTSVKGSSGDTEPAPRSARGSASPSDKPPSDRRSHRGTEASSSSALLRCAAADGGRDWYSMPSSRLAQPASRELVTDVTSKLHTATMLCAINVSSTVSALKVAAFDELLARRFAA